MHLISYWRHPGGGAHAAAYLGDGLIALPAKYGKRLTVWDIRDLKNPTLVAELLNRPDCQSVALCNGYLMLGSDVGIESIAFSHEGIEVIDCSEMKNQINDFEVANDTLLAVSKENQIKAVAVGKDGKLTDIGVRDNVLSRCHGASHQGNLVGVIGFHGDDKIIKPMGLFPDAVDDAGRFTDPARWTLANDGQPERWYMNISNRIVIHNNHAYVATGAKPIEGKKSWSLPPAVVVFDIADPSKPVLHGSYPCVGSTTCTGLYVDRDEDYLVAGASHIVRRFDIDGHLLRETAVLPMPFGDIGEGYPQKPATIHDVCKTDMEYEGKPVFAAGGQTHDDFYLFTA